MTATAPHYKTAAQQAHAARLGMWIFLSTELLLFGGLFVGYAFYRTVYVDGFHHASHQLSLPLGTINTYVLAASSFAVAAALHSVRKGRPRVAPPLLGGAAALGVLFLVFKGLEWHEHFTAGALPGPYYHSAEPAKGGAALFFSLYFLMTGLHAFHLVVGIGVLSWSALSVWIGAIGPRRDTPLEVAAMYWHFVDVIWIFLYPLLYLA